MRPKEWADRADMGRRRASGAKLSQLYARVGNCGKHQAAVKLQWGACACAVVRLALFGSRCGVCLLLVGSPPVFKPVGVGGGAVVFVST